MDHKASGIHDDCALNSHARVDENEQRFYCSRLLKDASSLFVSESSACRVDVRQHVPTDTADKDGSGVKSCSERATVVTNLAELRTTLNVFSPQLLEVLTQLTWLGALATTQKEEYQHHVRFTLSLAEWPTLSDQILTTSSTIHRMNSWSRMKITLDMFQMLCAQYKVIPRFLSLIEGMRNKHFPRDEHFTSGYMQCSVSPLQTSAGNDMPTSYNICYNLRHLERHGRDLQDPWSCRQVAVHHTYDCIDATSTWIIVQPPEVWSSGIDEVKLCRVPHPLSLHLCLVSWTFVSFRAYLDYISTELLKLDQQVSFEKPLGEIDFNFASSQYVQVLRGKLHHVVTILEGNQAILRTISALGNAMDNNALIESSASRYFHTEVNNISNDLQSYLSTSVELLNQSNDIKSMINSILEFRNQDVMKANGIQLQRIAENDMEGTKAVADIAQWTYNDSRTMRIATVIAMLYLPASLVLTLFSTCFVELRSSGTGLVVHREIWVAVLTIVALIGGNSLLLWVWDHRGKKSQCQIHAKVKA